MKRLFKRQISNQLIESFVRFFKPTSKVIVIIVLIALFLNYVPWNLILVKAETKEDNFPLPPETEDAYYSVDVDQV